VFKIDPAISQLRVADVNRDGAADLVVANNSKSTIEVLLQRTRKPDAPVEPTEVNVLSNDWRFERHKVSLTWRVACLRVADLTADGLPDLVFFGDPPEVVLLPGRGDGTFGDAVTRRVHDGMVLPGGIDVADMNGDGRLDVLALGESDVLVFSQRKAGGLGNSERFAHAIQDPRGLKAGDLNGDGRADVALMTGDQDYPLHIRYQDAAGTLGPVHRIKLPALRSARFAPCLGRKSMDLLGVERVSGRLKRWHVDANRDAASDADSDWSVLYYPLPGKSDIERLPLAIGDVNGDQRLDVVSANVDAAQLVLLRQVSDLGLTRPQSFGGQIKMLDLRCHDANADGTDEIYVLSAEEGTVARSTFHENRMVFPEALPTSGKPYALDVGRLTTESEPVLAYVSRDRESAYQLHLAPVASPTSAPATREPLALETLDEPPSAVRWADANHDGRNDILVFVSHGPLHAVLQKADGTFAPLDENDNARLGLVKQATVQGFAYADTTGDGTRDVLLAQKAFVRAFRIDEHGAWQIIDQYNAPTSDANITGLCVLSDVKSKRPILAMYDRRGGEVHFFTSDEGGMFSLDRSVRVGTFDVKAMCAGPLGGTETPCVLLADSRRLVLIRPDRPATRARERGAYESSIKDAHLWRLAAGDLNHDGVTDVAVIDTHDHFVEILTFASDASLVRATKFRVFAKKQFRGKDEESPEPRSIAIADVTSDKKDDLLLIAHDRILLYPGQ